MQTTMRTLYVYFNMNMYQTSQKETHKLVNKSLYICQKFYKKIRYVCAKSSYNFLNNYHALNLIINKSLKQYGYIWSDLHEDITSSLL